MATSSYQTYQVPSATTPGKAYRVTVHADGATACDCPDATYRRRQCKHQRQVLVLWTAAGRAGAFTPAAAVPAFGSGQRSEELIAQYDAAFDRNEFLKIGRGW
ncbi:MAG: hypothetical protein AB7R89_11160 [Dehalococcoidia bacterium]